VCDSAAYEPDPPLVRLPQGLDDITWVLDLKEPKGGTPTLPAIKGAIHAASMRQEQNPKIKAIVLLATDGFPTLCDPALLTPYEESAAGIPKVAKEAAAGRENGVQTFVIGVFSPEEADMAQTNLDTIALAGGGTPKAYLITTDEAVSEKFVTTLNEIRNSASACDYVLPRPGGVVLDAKHLKVKITSTKAAVWPALRSSFAECDPNAGGFVFDRDPNGPEPPARIQLCPASCALLDADPSAKVEVFVDCPRENG
jgi:hypothetical protein